MIIMLIISLCLLIKLMREKMKFLTILDIIFGSLYRFIRIYTEIPQTKNYNFYEQSNVKTHIYPSKTKLLHISLNKLYFVVYQITVALYVLFFIWNREKFHFLWQFWEKWNQMYKNSFLGRQQKNIVVRFATD